MTKALRIDIWSDIACPWCYVGKRRLEAALVRFEHRDAVMVTWHSFELDPGAPRVQDASVSLAARLARKYGMSVTQAEGMIRSMTDVAAREGLTFHFDRVRSGNTFDAHRLLHFASEHGLQGALKERLLRAYFTEGELVSERATLARLAGEAGLDEEAARAALASDAFADAVRADEDEARAAGIGGVPFFVFGEKYAVSGAQPPEVLQKVLEKAWAETPAAEPAAGATCGPEGCA